MDGQVWLCLQYGRPSLAVPGSTEVDTVATGTGVIPQNHQSLSRLGSPSVSTRAKWLELE
ncbi:hypothetical protein RSAG8_10520, partial [Rhizoctonia solani AG-8 WAC10335]